MINPDSFAFGLLLGFAGLGPLFFSRKTAVFISVQVAITVVSSVILTSFDSLRHAMGRAVVTLAADPNMALGIIVGLLLAGILSTIGAKRRAQEPKPKMGDESKQDPIS